MKRLCIIVVLLSLSLSLHAQKLTKWDINEPILGTILGVSFDYSETDFNGANYEAFCSTQQLVDKSETLEDAEIRFIEAFNNCMMKEKKKVFISNDKNGNFKYTLVVHPNLFSKFWSFKGTIAILSSDGEIVAFWDEFSGGRGGIYGSPINLIGDAYVVMAKKFAPSLSTALSRKKAK